jgi:hypothetical protein
MGFIIVGYVMYVLLTLWVSAIAVFVLVNPFGGNNNPLGIIFVVSLAVACWYGTYYLFPFEVSVKY